MRMMKKLAVASTALLPVLAMAHPGHHQHDASFWTGFVHPFTGLDHLVMALSFGVLMWTVSKQWKIAGVVGLVIALIVGFKIGAQAFIPVEFAEYGIVASLLILAVALCSKSNRIMPVAAILLATFHGVAHGVELGVNGHVTMQVSGMVSAMAMLYASGLALGALIVKYVPQGKKIMASMAAAVAVFGLL